jgi:hypothetical protein
MLKVFDFVSRGSCIFDKKVEFDEGKVEVSREEEGRRKVKSKAIRSF